MTEASMETAVVQLVARNEIHQLVLRYAWYLDSRDLDRLVALFVDDVRVTKEAVGHEPLRESFEAQFQPIGPTTLFVGNHLIDLDPYDDSAATGIVYCRGYIQEPDGFVEQMIVYTDRYRRDVTGTWLFVKRRHELMYGIKTSEQPHLQGPADWPKHSTGIGTLPFRLDSWQQFHTPESK